MTWNFRIVIECGKRYLAEVFYTEDGVPYGWCEIWKADFFRAFIETRGTEPLSYPGNFHPDGLEMGGVMEGKKA